MRNEYQSELHVLRSIRDLLKEYIRLREGGAPRDKLVLPAGEGEFFESLVRHSTDDILILDADCTIEYANAQVEESTGYPADELKGRRIAELLHPEEKDELEERFSRLVSSHGSTMAFFEFRVHHRDGSWRVFEGTGKNLLQDKQIGGVLVNAREITERKHVSQAMLQSQKMEALGLIAGGIAHDFRNIMAIILGAAEMLQMDPSEEDFERFLNMIVSSVHRGNAITERILEYARAEKPKFQSIPAAEYLEKIEEITAHTLPKNIDIRVEEPGQDLQILGDPGQLQQVLLNLCINAADAMPQGGEITLAVETAPMSLARKYRPHSQSHYASFRVKDTGVGMDDEVQERMFEPFFTTKEGGDGTGLGLATVYSIVQQHNGWIDVESEAGVGTTIRVGIPVAREEISEDHHAPAIETNDSFGDTILVVEDEPELRELITHLLTTKGYTVAVATNGKEAMEIYNSDPDSIGLVLTDLKMPVMSGNELEQYIHSHDPSMKMIAITGSLGLKNDKEVSREGFDEVIEKPFEVLEVLRIIQHTYDNSSVH